MNRLHQMPNSSARRLFLAMFFSELLLVFFYWIDILSGSPSAIVHALVDLDGEGNLPAWFSSFQLALISLSFWSIVRGHRKGETPSRGFWAFLASGFLLWSIDETAMMHERLTALLGSRYIDWLPGYLLGHKTIIAGGVAASLLILRLLWKDIAAVWRRHPHESRFAVAGLAISFFGGAVLETVGYKVFQNGANPFFYQTEVCFEELFEMLGASFLLYSATSLVLQRKALPAAAGDGPTVQKRPRKQALSRPGLI